MVSATTGADPASVPGATFRAWIPSITGRLSFSQIGQIGNHPCDNSEYDRSSSGCSLRCIEIRTSKIDDSIFKWKSVLNKIFGVNTVFRLDANAPVIGVFQPFLKGKIQCFVVSSYKNSITPSFLDEQSPAFTVSFCLHRSGNLCLFGLKLGPKIAPIDSENIHRLTKYFIAQSYYFLKDAIHRHRHHNSGDDTFIEALLGEPGWQSRIAFQLMKRVIRRPIDRNLEAIIYLRKQNNAIR